MPLDSKNGGPPLQAGDIVHMDWTIARVYPARFNVVRVSRTGSDGNFAGPPPASVAMRMSARPASVTMVDGAPMAEGNACTLLWRVTQTFPETGTVRVEREGLYGTPGGPMSYITITTGARAQDLELEPAAPAAMPREAPWRRQTREDEVLLDEIEPDMLPFGFDPVNPQPFPPQQLRATPPRLSATPPPLKSHAIAPPPPRPATPARPGA